MKNVIHRLFLLSAALLGACADNHEALEASYFEEAYEIAHDPERADSSSCNGVVVPDRGGFGKRIALTFDDGPNPATTPRVLEILRRRNIPAAFLMNGNRFTSQSAHKLLAEIAADPLFVVGSHSQNHVNLASASASTVRSELQGTADVLDAAGVARKWFRFPYGASTCQSMGIARDEFGYTPIGWHIDSADWCFQSGGGSCPKATFQYVDDSLRSNMVGWVLKQARANDGGVVLFHDVHANTANQLEAVLDALVADGFSFVRVDDAAAFPLLNGETPKPAPFIGASCASDADCGFTADGERGFCHPTGAFCTVECDGFCPDKAGAAPTFCIADPGAETARGVCASQPHALNHSCADLPMTANEMASRFVQTSSASPAMRDACVPMGR